MIFHRSDSFKRRNRGKKLTWFFYWAAIKKSVSKIPYLRRSYQTKKDVTDVLMEALPGTLILAFAAMFFAIINRNFSRNSRRSKTKYMDGYLCCFYQCCRYFCAFIFYGDCYCLCFWIWYCTIIRDYHLTGSWFDIDEITGKRYLTLQNLIFPAITLGIRPLAIITQLTRSSMLDVLNQDYIRTAYAKGLSKMKSGF